MDSSFSSSRKTKTKLSVRNQTRFKKSSFSSTKNTNISMRERTMLNKAYELSTLCDIQACVLYYGRDGELIKKWPEDQSKVRDMAERFSKLSDNEKHKKMNDEKKRSLDKNDNKFSDKVLEMEHSLETRLRIFQDKLRRLLPNQSLAVLSDCGASRTKQNHNFTDSSRTEQNHKITMDLSTSLIDDQSLAADSSGFTTHLSPSLSHHQQWTEESFTNHHLSDSLNQHQSKFSIFLYNHDNGNFSQLADSVSSFDQATAPYNMVIPPQMQTPNPLLHYDQFAVWNQTPSFGIIRSCTQDMIF